MCVLKVEVVNDNSFFNAVTLTYIMHRKRVLIILFKFNTEIKKYHVRSQNLTNHSVFICTNASNVQSFAYTIYYKKRGNEMTREYKKI